DQVSDGADKELAATQDAAARVRLRRLKVQTVLLVANLAKDDTSDNRPRSLQHALDLLANFEKDVEGLPNASALIGEVLYIRVTTMLSLGRTDEALDNLGKFLESRSGDEAIRIVYDMLEALNKEFEQAEHDGNKARMAELAGQRAKVSGSLVERIAKSSNPQVQQLLPQYKNFQATSLQKAALLETDPAKRREYLKAALKIFEDGLVSSPDDRGFQLAAALVQFDLGNYAAAKAVL